MSRAAHQLDATSLQLSPLSRQPTRFGPPSELYPRLLQHVMRVARALLGEAPSPELVHDATVDTVLSLVRYRGDCAFDSWVYSVAMHHVRKWIRAENRHRHVLLEASENVRAPDPYQPDNAAGAHRMAGRVFEAMHTLPERQRTCLTRVYLEGETPAAVAKELGVTPDAVRMNIHRARGHLRRRLMGGSGETVSA